MRYRAMMRDAGWQAHKADYRIRRYGEGEDYTLAEYLALLPPKERYKAEANERRKWRASEMSKGNAVKVSRIVQEWPLLGIVLGHLGFPVGHEHEDGIGRPLGDFAVVAANDCWHGLFSVASTNPKARKRYAVFRCFCHGLWPIPARKSR